MIKLVENNEEANLVLKHLSLDIAPLLAAKMFTEGFGVKQDFLQFYAAFNDNGKLCAAFVKCNDRVFCLIESLYDKEEILLFLNGFSDFKIFISSEFSNIIKRENFYVCNLMKKSLTQCRINKTVSEIESKEFSNIIMQNNDRERYIRFFLNNSHLQRHGYLKNFAKHSSNSVVSIASVYSNKGQSYLCNVFTPLNFRNKGYATELINEITEDGREYHLICNESVSKLYNNCGFITYSKWIEFLY